MDGRNPAPPKKAWNDDSPANSTTMSSTMVSFRGAKRFRPSTVVRGGGLGSRRCCGGKQEPL